MKNRIETLINELGVVLCGASEIEELRELEKEAPTESRLQYE